MANSTVLSRKTTPAGVNPSDSATKAQLDAAAGGYVTQGELFQPHTDWWPIPDATNGPLKTDLPITNVAPSLTGMTFIPWNSGKFNKQSQRWVAVPDGKGPASGRCVSNVATDRGNDYGGSGMPFPAPLDTWFYNDAPRMVVEYWVFNNHAANQGVATPNHEIHLMADHNGTMKGIRQTPAVWSNAQGGGNQTFYKEYEWTQGLHRQMRLMASAGVWFAGIWVTTGSRISMAPNKPLHYLHEGDSWAEPVGNVWASIGGNGASAGVTWPSGCSLLFSNTAVQLALATGMAVTTLNHGGTGYFNQGPSGQIDVDVAGFVGFSPFGSTSRVNHWSTTYGPEAAVNRYMTLLMQGGYNDGAGNTAAAYKARALKAFNKYYAKDPAMPTIIKGLQTKSITINADPGYWGANLGLKQAVADMQAAGAPYLGFIDDFADYTRAGVVNDMKASNLGPDGLHPTVEGGNFIGQNTARALAPMRIARSRVLQTMAVVVP